MARIVPVFIFLDGASIYTLRDLAFNLVDWVLWGGVRTPSHHRPFKVWFELEVHLNYLFARQHRGQHSKNPLVFLDELTETRVKVPALQLLTKVLLSMEVALPPLLLLQTPHSFRGGSSSQSWGPCWTN